ncbi:MAG: M48 family metallopeptidase [Alphaproteobacteria bacterium]|jgi:heat shock protein HtpX|nr:M48 family metallopeptidase [Alphaproteobacteria bacterium]
MRTLGLRTQIWNNALKSILLMAGFPVLLLLIVYGVSVLGVALEDQEVIPGLVEAGRRLPRYVPIAVVGALAWFAVAYLINTRVVRVMTGATPVTREQEPRLHNLLENLCISRGLAMPRLCVIETDALNAFAAGVSRPQYMIAVTRGLIDTLDDAELEAVLGHELSHIRNGDARLMMVAAVFVGIISLVSDQFGRLMRLFGNGIGRPSSSSSGGREKGSGGGALLLILVAIACFLLARLLAVAIRLAISRRREFMADAGAVELTRNPDAMIAALRKIEGRSTIADAPTQLRPMYIDVGGRSGFSGLFATHPPIADRIDALVRYAGGREPQPAAGPWGPVPR